MAIERNTIAASDALAYTQSLPDGSVDYLAAIAQAREQYLFTSAIVLIVKVLPQC